LLVPLSLWSSQVPVAYNSRIAYGYAYRKAYASALQSGLADERPYLYAYGSATIGAWATT